jgi:hypothetical protein
LECVEDVLEAIVDIMVKCGRGGEVETDLHLKLVGGKVVHLPDGLGVSCGSVD